MAELTTARLRLRELTIDEAEAIRAGRRVGGDRYADGYPLPDTADGLRLFLRHGDQRFGFSLIVRLEDEVVIGEIGFVSPPRDGSVTIGYAIVPAARRQGFATEAIAALSDWALAQPDVAEVQAQTLPDNEPSVRALLSAGFVEEGSSPQLRRFSRRAG